MTWANKIARMPVHFSSLLSHWVWETDSPLQDRRDGVTWPSSPEASVSLGHLLLESCMKLAKLCTNAAVLPHSRLCWGTKPPPSFSYSLFHFAFCSDRRLLFSKCKQKNAKSSLEKKWSLFWPCSCWFCLTPKYVNLVSIFSFLSAGWATDPGCPGNIQGLVHLFNIRHYHTGKWR